MIWEPKLGFRLRELVSFPPRATIATRAGRLSMRSATTGTPPRRKWLRAPTRNTREKFAVAASGPIVGASCAGAAGLIRFTFVADLARRRPEGRPAWRRRRQVLCGQFAQLAVPRASVSARRPILSTGRRVGELSRARELFSPSARLNSLGALRIGQIGLARRLPARLANRAAACALIARAATQSGASPTKRTKFRRQI